MFPPRSSPKFNRRALLSGIGNRHSAFTLIEVTLAIGIVAVAVLSMAALMPVGLRTMKDATESMVTAQILNKVSSIVQTTPFGTELNTFIGRTPLFYDRTGRDVPSADKAFFSATLSSIPTSYPGAPNDLFPSSARTLEITISVLKPGTATPISSNKSALIIPKS